MKKSKDTKQTIPNHAVVGELKFLKEFGDQIQKITDSITQTRGALDAGLDWSAAHSAWMIVAKQLPSLLAMSDRVQACEAFLLKRSEQEFLVLEADLRESCAKQNWKIDGQWPKLFIERAIAVEIHEKDHSATVAGIKIDRANVDRIVSFLKPIIQELVPRGFSAISFMEKVAGAYDQAREKSVQVPILEVYRVLVLQSQKPRFWRDAREEAFVGLSLDQFRARLSRALEEAAESYPARSGRQLRLLPPLDPRDAVFLYQPFEARFGFIGRIEFIPVNPVSERQI